MAENLSAVEVEDGDVVLIEASPFLAGEIRCVFGRSPDVVELEIEGDLERG